MGRGGKPTVEGKQNHDGKQKTCSTNRYGQRVTHSLHTHHKNVVQQAVKPVKIKCL